MHSLTSQGQEAGFSTRTCQPIVYTTKDVEIQYDVAEMSWNYRPNIRSVLWDPMLPGSVDEFSYCYVQSQQLMLLTVVLTCRFDKLLHFPLSGRNNEYLQQCFYRPLLQLRDRNRDASLSLKGNSWVRHCERLAQSQGVEKDHLHQRHCLIERQRVKTSLPIQH